MRNFGDELTLKMEVIFLVILDHEKKRRAFQLSNCSIPFFSSILPLSLLFSSQAETEDARVSYRAELGMQSTHQAVTDNQQADFAERDRLDSGLLAWQPTQDVRYLQATAQRNTLRAVQNKQGDR